jgi:protein-tyrosine phosphatase
MKPDLYWVNGLSSGRLAVAPRPRAGDWLDDEIRGWRRAGVDAVVSLLTPDEVTDLDLAEEEAVCRREGIRFFTWPITDRGVPVARVAFENLLASLKGLLAADKAVVVHCRQGIGRAALVAVCLLVWSGHDVEAAIRLVGAARGVPVPETPEQREWVSGWPTYAPPLPP